MPRSPSTSDAIDRLIRSQGHIDRLEVNPHHRRIIQTAWDLGGLADLDELNLRRWAHMLAFRGNFLSKSKAYSTTFKQIRGDRRRFRRETALAELGIDDESTITVINRWHMTSVGPHQPRRSRPRAQPRSSGPRPVVRRYGVSDR